MKNKDFSPRRERLDRRIREELAALRYNPDARGLDHKIRKELSSFQVEFRKHLAAFITGAFAFVAALLWRDAIQSFLNHYTEAVQSLMPIKETWFTQFFMAFSVSIVAVVAIVVISKLLKV